MPSFFSGAPDETPSSDFSTADAVALGQPGGVLEAAEPPRRVDPKSVPATARSRSCASSSVDGAAPRPDTPRPARRRRTSRRRRVPPRSPDSSRGPRRPPARPRPPARHLHLVAQSFGGRVNQVLRPYVADIYAYEFDAPVPTLLAGRLLAVRLVPYQGPAVPLPPGSAAAAGSRRRTTSRTAHWPPRWPTTGRPSRAPAPQPGETSSQPGWRAFVPAEENVMLLSTGAARTRRLGSGTTSEWWDAVARLRFGSPADRVTVEKRPGNRGNRSPADSLRPDHARWRAFPLDQALGVQVCCTI